MHEADGAAGLARAWESGSEGLRRARGRGGLRLMTRIAREGGIGAAGHGESAGRCTRSHFSHKRGARSEASAGRGGCGPLLVVAVSSTFPLLPSAPLSSRAL